MADEPDPERMERLERRLSQVRGSKVAAPASGNGASWSQGEVAWRMVIEMVSGLLIGLAIGYGLDWLFGTLPIMLVIFTLLGFVAGIRTMLGTAGELRAKHEAAVAAGQVPPARAVPDNEAGDAGDERG